MKPEAITALLAGLKEAGVDFVAFLPSTAFEQVIPALSADPAFLPVAVSHEGDAVSLCAGAWLGGKKPALLAENSGLILGAHSLMGLDYIGGVPMLLVLDHRGDFGEGQGYWYFPGGHITPALLSGLDIPYLVVRKVDEIRESVIKAQRTVEASYRPAAVLLSGEAAGW